MVDDVRLAVGGRRPVEFYGRQSAAWCPAADEVLEAMDSERGRSAHAG